MEIDLELPTHDQEKMESGSNKNIDVVDSICEINVEEEHVISAVSVQNIKETHGSNANQFVSSAQDQMDANTVELVGHNKGAICAPCIGMEFESKEEAYSFYREYARSVGFGITIKASRRSKKSGKFIDIKIVCSRFGNKRESGTTLNPRPCMKTGCKASMHMKRKENGKWVIHGFVKEHNHGICPDDFYYAIRGRNKQSAIVACEKKGLQLALDEVDVQIMLEHFMCMQEDNPIFFYSLDLDHEKRLKSIFWVDAKGRHDYNKFYDVVFFDTFYLRNKYRIPFVPIVGVNNHFQYILLGCALVGEETTETFVWLMRTWLKAMGSQSPRVIITDQDKFLKEAVADVFPDARHCFCLWHVLIRIHENLGCIINQDQNFIEKFNKCIYRSWTEEQFETKWWKMVNRFELAENEWVHSLFEDREKWVPYYMKDTFLAGMSTTERSGSVTSFFDKYILPETTFKEFIERLDKEFMKDSRDMEAKADFETRRKQPELKSLSPFEKQVSSVYTEAIFEKFQIEVLGVDSCHLKKEGENEAAVIFQVDDFEEHQNFVVDWNEAECKICCLCRSFEYRGFLCRHTLLVLQISGTSYIPAHFILKRWTKDAKINQNNIEMPKRLNLRFDRFNDLCKLAIKLGEEGSLSPEAYHIALQTLDEVLQRCVDVNNSVRTLLEPGMSAVNGFLNVEEEKHRDGMGKSTKKMKTYKKRKGESDPDRVTGRMQESGQQMMNSRAHNLEHCYIPQQDMQEELGSRAPSIDDYYAAQESIQGVVRLNSISPIADGYYCNQQGMQGQLHSVSTRAGNCGIQQNIQGLLQGQLSFRVAAMHGCFDIQNNLQDMQQSVGSSHFRSIASKHLQDKHLSP